MDLVSMSRGRNIMKSRGRRGGERGAVLVETAILIPVIVMITFGLIEFSMVYQSSSTGAAAARAGARTASAEAKLPNYATDAAAAAATALKTIGSEEPVELWVYKGNTAGYPEPNGNTGFSVCAANCIKYPWDPLLKKFDTASPSGGGWPYTSQQACDVANWDSVGVYIKLSHKFLTNLFGSTITLTDHAVFRLEPAPTQACS
jgi:hypothetical protein